jgi:hypothetical protein
MLNTETPAQSLYEQDFMLWIETTVQLLKDQRLTESDLALVLQ